VAVGLVTGNLEPIAWGKMQALGLLEAFSEPHFGGFGSDYCSGAHQASRRLPACHFQRVARASAGWYISAHHRQCPACSACLRLASRRFGSCVTSTTEQGMHGAGKRRRRDGPAGHVARPCRAGQDSRAARQREPCRHQRALPRGCAPGRRSKRLVPRQRHAPWTSSCSLLSTLPPCWAARRL